jgi:telomere length regulation protein
MAISRLTEPSGDAMKFDLAEIESDKAQWYLNLTQVQDNIGSLESLRNQEAGKARQPPIQLVKKTMSKVPLQERAEASSHTSKIVSIEEISDGTGDNDEELIPYEKPDTDASDSEDDPTLIQRSKPTVPV